MNRPKNSWQRPTLPYSHPYSTIGPAGLVCSVRNGKRNFTRGIVTRKLLEELSRPALAGRYTSQSQILFIQTNLKIHRTNTCSKYITLGAGEIL